MSISPLSKKLSIAQADGTLPHRYDILVNDKNELQWFEGSDSEDTVRAGQPVVHKWTFFGGGACETVDMGKGGYFFSSNCTVCNPFRIRPRPETTSVTLTSNAVPVERFFEAEDSSSNKYLYCLAGAKSFKIKNLTATPALAETKTWASPTVIFDQGTYTGNGVDDKAITDCAFTPAFVIVKGDLTEVPVAVTTDMPAGKSEEWGTSTALVSDGIKTLETDGFTIGTSDHVNKNGETYYWYAWKAEAGVVATGTYTGDAADDRDITGAGFKPAFATIFGDAAGVNPTRFSTFKTADWAVGMTQGSIGWANMIQAFNDDGFQVGTHDSANKAATEFYWVALRSVTGRLVVGTYDGNGQDGRPISGIGFQPTYIVIHAECTEGVTSTAYGVHRGTTHSGDSSQSFQSLADAANRIESIDSDGFTVGSDEMVNKDGAIYHYICVAAGGTPQVGKPAMWNSLWRVPMGQLADAETLSSVHNEGGAGDDTWAPIYGLAANHFSPRGNKLGRATKRHVSLCAADDIANSDNWGAEYPVGPPDTVITDLVEWGAELAVPTTDGMYMFDGVATSRQQLPLMGGIKDADNGKNTLNWLGLILVPTKGGLLRWQYGAAKAVGPDSIFGYVEAEGVANEPIHLQHFGLAYLEDWIYEAVYDGTNYHIIYYRPSGEAFQVDFLLTSSSVIKTVFVDTNAILWYGLGNNLSSIQLTRSGAPTGGNYGEASLTGSFYTSEKLLADGANVRCRMAKVETDNNQSTLTWKLYSIRDGATAEQVGAAAGFKTDGEQKLYWTAASNLLARRLRYRLDFACSSFTPETTPPECLVLEFHGEALPDDADLIRVVVSLDSERRANKTVYDELAAHENAGVRKVRSPITDEILTVTIYRRELEWVKQRGTEPPKVGVMLYMRRGDVA